MAIRYGLGTKPALPYDRAVRSPRSLLLCICVGFGLGFGLGGCITINEQSVFEAEARDRVCNWDRVCAPSMSPSSPLTDPIFPYPTDDTCEDTFEAERVQCSDCRFNPTAAYKCLDRMEEALAACSTQDINFKPCRKVYTDCASDEVEDQCDIRNPTCSVHDDARPQDALLALGLLGLGLFARRRRREA